MSSLLTEIQARVPGSWDGHDDELHGLVRVRGVFCKIVLAREGELYSCVVFVSGAVLVSTSDESGLRALGAALREVGRG